MSYSVKLLIPLALGVLAALTNLTVLSARTKPVEYLRVTRDIPAGEPITELDLAALPMPGPEAAPLKETAVAYAERSNFLGQPALRDFLAGDIVFYRDFPTQGDVLTLRPGELAQPISLDGAEVPPAIMRIGQWVKLIVRLKDDQPTQQVGPFRLVSVGDRVRNNSDTSVAQSVANVISVAVQQDPSPKEAADQALLVELAAGRQDRTANLVAVQILGGEGERDQRVSVAATHSVAGVKP